MCQILILLINSAHYNSGKGVAIKSNYGQLKSRAGGIAQNGKQLSSFQKREKQPFFDSLIRLLLHI